MMSDRDIVFDPPVKKRSFWSHFWMGLKSELKAPIVLLLYCALVSGAIILISNYSTNRFFKAYPGAVKVAEGEIFLLPDGTYIVRNGVYSSKAKPLTRSH